MARFQQQNSFREFICKVSVSQRTLHHPQWAVIYCCWKVIFFNGVVLVANFRPHPLLGHWYVMGRVIQTVQSWNKTAWAAAAWGIWGFERTVFWSNARSVWEICTSADKSKTIHRYFTRKSWHNNQTLLLAILDLFHPDWTFLILSRQRRKFDSYKRFVKDSLFGVKCNWGRMD